MSGISTTLAAHPRALADFRATTQRQAGATAGITTPSFLCRRCGQPRTTLGRRSLGWRAGYACALCVAAAGKQH